VLSALFEMDQFSETDFMLLCAISRIACWPRQMIDPRNCANGHLPETNNSWLKNENEE